MEEALLALGLAILAVGVAVFLRVSASRAAGSDEIGAALKSVAAFQRMNRELERKNRMGGECFQQVPEPVTNLGRLHPVSLPVLQRETVSPALLANRREPDRATEWLYALKSVLPQEACLGQQYVDEFDSILDLLERESGANLSRFRLTAPCYRSYLRLNILALLGFCSYQLLPHLQPPRGFVPAPPGAARRVH